MAPSGICEMCGHHVGLRQKAHIVTEATGARGNLLMLCPTCHVMFNTQLKPKLRAALVKHGVTGMPSSWAQSIYDQAGDALDRVLNRKRQPGRKARVGRATDR